ncbi:MAG: hypothetical protein WAN92_07030 [Herbaspirillum sp.]
MFLLCFAQYQDLTLYWRNNARKQHVSFSSRLMLLKDKVALVTSAASDIGSELRVHAAGGKTDF